MTGQRAAQRKNSPKQWGRPFGRAPREICLANSIHPHWGGDCTTTMRWQDAGPVMGVRVGAELKKMAESESQTDFALTLQHWLGLISTMPIKDLLTKSAHGNSEYSIMKI